MNGIDDSLPGSRRSGSATGRMLAASASERGVLAHPVRGCLGAALFLLVWWARHWHRTRRSTKLVEARHPSARGPGH